MMDDLLPGARVKVFDHLLFKDDVTTPLSYTMRPATVVCRYGYSWKPPIDWGDPDAVWRYPDCVDVIFDHRPERVSRAHFTDMVEQIRSIV